MVHLHPNPRLETKGSKEAQSGHDAIEQSDRLQLITRSLTS
jgi:hypothetical protein